MAIAPKKTKPPGVGSTKRRGRGKWIALGALALTVFLAVETGWAGFGLAQLRSAVYPNDTALLGWVPGDTAAVAILDPHQLKLGALGAEGSTVREAFTRTRDDVKRVTGVDLAFDVDKLVLTPALVVARGRFDQKKLADKLAEHRYAVAEHKGVSYLVRSGEDAIAVVDGSILLYGDEPSLTASIDAHEGDTSLEKSDPVKARLSQVGWHHALLFTYRIADDKPSLRAVLTGATGPRAITASASTLATPTVGLELDTIVEAASPSAGAELAKLLDEQRRSAAALTPAVGAEAAPILVDVAKKATIVADAQTGMVKIHVHVDPAQLDTLVKAARASVPAAQMYKALRLFQLLSPG